MRIVAIPCSIVLAWVFVSTAVKCAKMNTPRVLLPWFEDIFVNFTFEIHDGGCYRWSLSRDDIIDLEPLFEHTFTGCSRAARVKRSKQCTPPGTAILLAEEVNSGEILRGDVDIEKIASLQITTTSSKLYLEEAPEAFEVQAFDTQGNTFSTLEGVPFEWKVKNIGITAEDESSVNLVWYRDADYEAPPGVLDVEARGLRSYSTLLYGQAMGDVQVTACLGWICDDVKVSVVASVVLVPAIAIIAPGDTINYRVVRARAGKLTSQNIIDTTYKLVVDDTEETAFLEDGISLVRGNSLGTTTLTLYSGTMDVATASLTVSEPHSIRVFIRPDLLVRDEQFIIQTTILDVNGKHMTAGDEVLIRLSVEGPANVELLQSTENGTITAAVPYSKGELTVTAKLYSIAGKVLSKKVEGVASAVAIEPLTVEPPELFIAWTDHAPNVQLSHRGGGDYPVVWSGSEESGNIAVESDGLVKAHGFGWSLVTVQLKDHPHVKAVGSVLVAKPEVLRVATSGHARVSRPHYLHVGLTAAHHATGELYNFHRCNCESLAVSLLEGPEPHNVTAANWVEPMEGACCVLSATFLERGVASLRVTKGRLGDTARVSVRASPHIVWPPNGVVALHSASVPVLALGEALSPHSAEPRVAELAPRDGAPPHRHPDLQLFTLTCKKKGETTVELRSESEEDGVESAQLRVSCAPLVARVSLAPPAPPGNCSDGKLWIPAGAEAVLAVTPLDAQGMELHDERGHKMRWEPSPAHPGIQFDSPGRLLVETHPEYVPVPVPVGYHQIVAADVSAAGWSGALKVSSGETSATVHARVVGPLTADSNMVYLAWEGETSTEIAKVSGGSGQYAIEAPKAVGASMDGGALRASVPGPGGYELVVSDQCVAGERAVIEVQVEDVRKVEVVTWRAVCVDACAPVCAVARGSGDRYLTTSTPPEYKISGPLEMKGGMLCGNKEGVGRIKAFLAGVWSHDVEVVVFPALVVVPARARLPPGARLQLRHVGGPPSHLAAFHYEATAPSQHFQVSQSGLLSGWSVGAGKVRLYAQDTDKTVMAMAESDVEVVAVTGVRARAGTGTLLVGAPSPLWLEAEGALGPAILAALQPAPRVAWTLREPHAARLYSGVVDDKLERSTAEGLSVKVVPLKAGLITIDVHVKNIAPIMDTRNWDSTVEILAVSDLKVSVEGYGELASSDRLATSERLALAVGAAVQLRSTPKASWTLHSEDGAMELSGGGQLVALKPGHGVAVASHMDERNGIYRESAVHIEVSAPHYATVEPSDGDEDETTLRLAVRSALGRRLLAPNLTLAVLHTKVSGHVRSTHQSALGPELLLTGLDRAGAFITVEGALEGTRLQDHVWIEGSDVSRERVMAVAGWVVCLEGGYWRAPPSLQLVEGLMTSLVVLNTDGPMKHVLKAENPPRTKIIQQLPLSRMEFQPGLWPPSMVPLVFEASGMTGGPMLCTEEERLAFDGVEAELPFTCRTMQPHSARPVLDVTSGQMGCSVITGNTVIEAKDIELCAEWGNHRTCTQVILLPPIQVLPEKLILSNQPSKLSVIGHPKALKSVKVTASPGVKIETSFKSDTEIVVHVQSDLATCGKGWLTVTSRLTSQVVKVVADRECNVACGSLLEAMLAMFLPVVPSLSTLLTTALLFGVTLYAYNNNYLAFARMKPPAQTDLSNDSIFRPPRTSPPRTWSRSPYSSSGPVGPIYGDTSVLPDQSFSPNRSNSTYL